MNRQKAIELANKIQAIRRKRWHLDVPALLRLKDMCWQQQQEAMERLVSEGYADSIEDIERMLNSRDVCRYVLPSYSPTESAGMSDDKTYFGVHNLSINKELL